MKVLRRITAILVMILGVLFFVLFAGGAVGAWSVRVPIADGLLGLVAPIEYTAQTAGEVIDKTDGLFAEAQAEVNAVDASLKELQSSAELQDQLRQEARQAISQTIGARLAPVVADARAGMETVSAVLAVADETMQAINQLPLVRDPLPGSTQVSQLNQRVATFGERVDELRQADRQLDLQASETLQAVDDLLVKLDDGAQEVRTALAEYRQQVSTFEAQIQAVKAAIPPTVFWSIFGTSFLLGWLAASQISLIMHAWAWYKKP